MRANVLYQLLAFYAACSCSFHVTSASKSSATKVALSAEGEASSSANSNPRPTNLVDQTTFANAIEMLRVEVAKANNMVYEKEDNKKDLAYAIGRLTIQLPVTPAPQMDLTETPTLVLVSAVGEVTAETGLQALDTIVSVSSGSGTKPVSTLQMDLEGTATILQKAMMEAIQNGEKEIELELNRLMQGYYGDAEK